MDIQRQVAARRAQLEEDQRRVQAGQIADDKARATATREREESALDAIAEELSRRGTPVQHDDGQLVIAEESLAVLDIEGLKQSKVRAMLKREARRRWTPGDNWFVIGFIVTGICTIPLHGLGLVLIGVGLWRRAHLNKEYRAALQAKYPTIFDSTT